MSDIDNRRCSIDNCQYLTSFERCDKHAIVGDVNFKKCIVCLSYKATFGDSIPLRCVEHRLKTDYNLARCFHDRCYRVPKYCIGVGLTPTFCYEHYPDGYIHVGTCTHENCERKCEYGSLEDGVKRYCRLHKRPGDNNLLSKSIGSKMCGIDGCTRQGNFGITKRTRCSFHKKDGDTLISNRKCCHPGCSKSSTFGLNGKRTHCNDHKPYDATSIINRRKRSRKEYEVGKGGKRSQKEYEFDKDGKRSRKEYEFDIEDFKFVGDENLDDLILGLDFNF